MESCLKLMHRLALPLSRLASYKEGSKNVRLCINNARTSNKQTAASLGLLYAIRRRHRQSGRLSPSSLISESSRLSSIGRSYPRSLASAGQAASEQANEQLLVSQITNSSRFGAVQLSLSLLPLFLFTPAPRCCCCCCYCSRSRVSRIAESRELELPRRWPNLGCRRQCSFLAALKRCVKRHRLSLQGRSIMMQNRLLTGMNE